MLGEIADMLQIKGEIIYKQLAYRRAAESIEALGRDLRGAWEEGKLRDIPRVGPAIEAKLDELFRTGRIEYYDRLQEEIPAGVVSLLAIPDVGPKTARLIWEKLGLLSVGEVETAAREGKLRDLPGMGARSEQRILEGIESLNRRSDRIPLGMAWPVAAELMAALDAAAPLLAIETAGSLRRMRETIGDIDLLASADETEAVMKAFVGLPQVAEVSAQGSTKATVILHNGLQVDLRVLRPEHWGAALQYFTGSQAHNVALREMARDAELSLSEYGFKTESGELITCPEESDVYSHLGLPWIPPELREDRGELAAASKGRLPDLVAASDLRGDLHMHSSWSDGAASIEEMVQAAQELGHRYVAISDHTQSLGVANGLTHERFLAQRQEIADLQARFPDIRILQGAEVEIKADGELDLDDNVLSQFDVVIASVHSGLRQDAETITARAVQAMRNPQVDILGHPSGRLLGKRPASAVDLDRVIDVAVETGTLLEVNSIPDRLDLDDAHIRRATEKGARLVINSDAHSPVGLTNLRFGVATARRGWATTASIVNTLEVDDLRTRLAKKGRG